MILLISCVLHSKSCEYNIDTFSFQYVCRKTLADSRPRIRGRFARNDEIGNSSQNQWSQMRGEEDYEDDDNWIHFLDSFMGNLIP